jgi:ParB-like chromosome segregation protein Spo0J
MDSYKHDEGELLPLSRRFPEQQHPPSMEKVRDFASQMRNGVSFPLIRIVFGRDGIRFYIQDGEHRTAASLLCGFTMIPCVVNPNNPWGFIREQ